MLHQVQELSIFKCMDGRRTRNANLFPKMSLTRAEAGFIRMPEQIRIKWKNVRSAYTNGKRNNSKSGQGRISCPYYDMMDDLLGRRPMSQATERGVDAGGVEEADQGELL